MELKIINRNENRLLGYDGYLEWEEKLDNINSRPFKKNFDFIKIRFNNFTFVLYTFNRYYK